MPPLILTWVPAPLILLVISAVALVAGSRLLTWLRLVDGATPGRLLFELAAGYMLLGYLLAAVGLAGHLTLPVAGGILVLAALAGIPAVKPCLGRIAAAWAHAAGALRGPGGPWWVVAAGVSAGLVGALALFGTGVTGESGAVVAAACVVFLAGLALWRPAFGLAWLLAAWCLITLLGALAPPTAHDYDGLAQHLAHAKVYARTATYAPLWYDHHSHFPALTQILFSLGFLLKGVAAAKLFHWAFGMLTLGAAYVAARRFSGPGSGKWALVTVAGMPIMGWLMQVGYVDLATSAYAFLAVLAFLRWRRAPSSRPLALCGLMLAGCMATKMQGVPVFGVLVGAVALTLALRRAGLRRIATGAAVVGLTGALIAAPWYVNTWVLTGNPVYPFAYEVFGGKYWGPEEARNYSYEQKSFGVGSLPPPDEYEQMHPLGRIFTGPRSPVNLLLAPWNLTFNPVPFTAQWRGGAGALPGVLLSQWIGPLYLLGLLALAGLWIADRRRAAPSWPAGPGALLWLFLPLWAWWLFSMQLERYLVPSLVLIAPATAYAWARLQATLLRAVPTLWMAAALAGVGYLSAGDIAVVTGMLPREQYLRALAPMYEAAEVVNRLAPADGRVILYGEPRGFYIDRDYLWGDPGHHRMIPYERLDTPEALVTHLRGMGITHTLIGLAQTGGARAGPPVSLLYQAVEQGLATLASDDALTRRGYVVLDLRGPAQHPDRGPPEPGGSGELTGDTP